MWRASVKSLLARKLRLTLTALSILLGVGFVAGTFVLTDTMSKAFDELFSSATEGTDVIVRAETAFDPIQAGPGGSGTSGRKSIAQNVLPLVQGVEGVKSATGSVQGYAQLVDPKTNEPIGGFGPPTIGGNWDPTAFSLRSGQPPQGSGEVVVDAATAERSGLRLGDRLKILFQGPPAEFMVSGIAGFGEADNLAGATMALFDLKTAQQVLGKEGALDSISVVAEEEVSAVHLGTRIASVLPEGIEAKPAADVAEEDADAIKENLGFFQIALLVFAFIALFVGAFSIYNTFSIITAQRTRELALFRALGASRRQVMASVLTEAAITGVFGSVLGIGAGILIAFGLQNLLAAFGIDLPGTETQVLPRTVVVSLVLGTIVTVASAIQPARRASRVAPIEAIRETQQAFGFSLRRRVGGGAVLTGIGAVVLLYGLFGRPANAGQIIGLATAATFIGIAMVSPVAARPIAGMIGALPRRLGISGKLGRENAMRNPRRTASTASALMIGLGLVAVVTILASSLKASFDAALRETLKADFTLTSSSFTPFSPEVANLVRQRSEVSAVSEFRVNGFRAEGATSFLTAVDPATIEDVATLNLVRGSVDNLSGASVLVHEGVAGDHGWDSGDTVSLEFPSTGKRRFTIGGIYEENRLVGDWVTSLETYETHYAEQLDTFVLVKGARGVPPAEVKEAIEESLAGFPGVEVQDQTAFREQQAGFINQLLGLVSALLALAVVIALFGIVNTLGLSIYERIRELGLLRSVGMTRRQVRTMIRWEAVIIAVLGAVLGIVVGVLFGWALQQALASEGVTKLDIPVGQLVLYVALAALAGVLAAVLPARRAARLNLLEAIAYE